MYVFKVGTVVHHRRYDYRGVVFQADPVCKASDDWFLANQTQPNRDQPWYHVLVDGGYETYVAESSLEPDFGNAPIDHPKVGELFPTFLEGRYYVRCLN